MAGTSRIERKGVAAVRKHLNLAGETVAYSPARSGSAPAATIGLVLGAILALDIVLVVSTGVLVGGLGVFLLGTLLINAFNPPRAVVVTSDSVAVVEGGLFRPVRSDSRVTNVPHAAFLMEPARRNGWFSGFPVNSGLVWMTSKQARPIADAIRGLTDADRRNAGV